MAILFKKVSSGFFEFIPLLLLLFISLNGNSIIDLNFFSISIHYILVYYWVLRKPGSLGYGFIFLSGIISDVIFGLPMGVMSLSLLVVASVATYVRVVTVRISLLNDWVSFLPALLLASLFYFIALYFSGYPTDYIYLIKNSFFTFIFYPVLWSIFYFISNIMRGD
jgi:cell shape-determining protein MreD